METIRTNRVINVQLLFASLALVAVSAVAGYLWYGHRVKLNAHVFEQRAVALEKEGRWRDAATYLERLLQMQPDDTEARLRLVSVVERLAKTPTGRRQFIALLYDTLGRTPDRNDLRLKLASQLLDTGQFAAAEIEAIKIASASPTIEEKHVATRLIALSVARRAREGILDAESRPDSPDPDDPNWEPIAHTGPIGIREAADQLDRVLIDSPGDVNVASLAAYLHRTYPERLRSEDNTDPASKADSIMDKLVEVASKKVDALLARYNHRRRVAESEFAEEGHYPSALIEKARQDLQAALAIEPQNIEALLFAASEDLASSDKSARSIAKQRLLKVVELAPNDPRGHIGLAQLQAANGDRNASVNLLLRGRGKLDTPSFELDGLLVATLIEIKRFDEARRVLSEFDETFRQSLPDLTVGRRLQIENFGRLLQARLSIASNELAQAVRDLNAIIASVRQVDGAASANELLRAYAMRADIMAKLGRLDLAATDWQVVADKSPRVPEARFKAALAYLEVGRPNAAIHQLELYLKDPNASPDARIALVQAHLRRQMRLPVGERLWTEFDDTVREAKRTLPNRWEPQVAEALSWHARAVVKEEFQGKAMLHLQSLEKMYADDRAFWRQLVYTYQQLRKPAAVERALARYKLLETNTIQRTLVRSSILAQQGKTDEASKLLASAVPTADVTERRQLEIARVNLLLAGRRLDEAQQAAAALISESPRDRSLLTLGLEVAILRQDFAVAQHWEEALKQSSTTDDFEWRFYRASRLAAQYAELDAPAKAELQSLVESLRSQRPAWFPVIALAGLNADVTGSRQQAIDYYRLSIELGDDRPQTYQRLVAALNASGRYKDAYDVLQLFAADQFGGERADLQAIELAVKNKDFKLALDRAQEAVDRGSADPMHFVWLANLLSQDGQQEAAERVFRDSVDRYPNDNRVWNGFFSYLVQTKQLDRARRALEKWTAKVENEETKRSILAQGHELLGDTGQAQEQYRAIIAQDPRNVDARLRLAKLLLSNDVIAAREHFEDVLKIDPENTDARRGIAALLASSGETEDWNRVERLLQSNRNTPGDAQGDDRLRAILLARRGNSRQARLSNSEAARRILTTRLSQSVGNELDLDRMLLSSIYEQEAVMRDDWEFVRLARNELRALVDRDSPPAEYIVMYIRFLLRHLEREQLIGDDIDFDAERAIFVDDARTRITELERSLTNDKSERRFLPIAFSVRLLVAQGERDEGLQVLNSFAAKEVSTATNNADRAKLFLQLGNLCAQADYHKDAEKWYRQLLNIAPNSYMLLAKSLIEQNKINDAVDICLQAASTRPSAEVAMVLAQLLPVDAMNEDLEERVEPVIKSAIATSDKNVELLMSVAIRHVTADEYDDAIRLFRRVLVLEPNHTLALNNLATLLAERPNALSEARRHIERAMTIAGRNPPLLDTYGTILMRAGKYDQAVEALKEAVAGIANDPRYYFHLAVAYQRSGNDLKAQQHLKVARKHGLDRAILTSGDRELLQSLKDHLLTSIQN